MTTTWTISTLDKPPSMNSSKVTIDCQTYEEAVKAARDSYKSTNRTTALWLGNGTYWFHRICKGIATDRNTNSGIPQTETI